MAPTTTAPADTGSSTAIGGGEILSTAQLRGEVAQAEAVLAEFTALIHVIGGWANGLPDRYVAAPFGTTALSDGVTHVTEANGDAGQIGEALTEIDAALDEADSLGETVSGLEADGDVDAFKSST